MGWASWCPDGAFTKQYYYYVVSHPWGALSRAMRHKRWHWSTYLYGPMLPRGPGTWVGQVVHKLTAVCDCHASDPRFWKAVTVTLYRQTHNLLIIHLIFLARGVWWGARGVSLYGKSRAGPLAPRFKIRIDFDEMRTRWWSYSHCLLIMLTHSAYS